MVNRVIEKAMCVIPKEGYEGTRQVIQRMIKGRS